MSQHDGTGIAIAGFLAGLLLTAHKPSTPTVAPYRPANPFWGQPDTQVIARMSREMGVRQPRYTYACRHIDRAGELHDGYAGLADLTANLMLICPANAPTEAHRHYTIAHELAHFRHHQQGTRTTEAAADRDAIDYLVSVGAWDAIRARAAWNPGPAYQSGTRYAQQAIAQRQP